MLLAIALTGAVVFIVLPQYGIRTLPGRVEYFSEPEPETVEYVARPAVELGKQILSSWVSEQSPDWTWAEARGKWVLWKGNVHSIEPALNPSRIVLVYEYKAPFYSRRFGVVVEIDAQWRENLKDLVPGETVYFRAKLVDKELRMADAYRYGLGLSPRILLLEQGQIIDSNDRAARLVDLAYASHHRLDLLLSLAEQTATVANFFEQRLTLNWTAIQGVQILSPITIPESPGEPSEAVLAPIRAIKTGADARIEASVAPALKYLHTVSSRQNNCLTKFVEQQRVVHASLVTQRYIEAQKLWEAYQLQQRSPGLAELATEVLKLVPGIGGIIGEILAIREAIAVYDDLKEADKIVASCYILLGAITNTMEQISNNVTQAAVLAGD